MSGFTRAPGTQAEPNRTERTRGSWRNAGGSWEEKRGRGWLRTRPSPGPAPLLYLSATKDQLESWEEGAKRLLAVSLKAEIKPAASRSGEEGRGVGGRRSQLGEVGKDPEQRRFRGATALPAPAAEGQRGSPRGPQGEDPAAGPGADGPRRDRNDPRCDHCRPEEQGRGRGGGTCSCGRERRPCRPSQRWRWGRGNRP